MAHTERLAQLRQNLVGYYDLEELHTLCFHLGVDYDGLGGEGKESKARELVADLERRGRVRHLIEWCNKLRPKVEWEGEYE
jgi:hypothetical protein